MNKKKNEPNYKKILFQLCAGLTFSDHLEDVGDDVVKALELYGTKFDPVCTKCGNSMSTDEIELGLSQCCGDDE